ncbi:MAG: response regulator transcription factor [Paludibacteraceae bacterium]|jgi:DNA-binding response OmpR family regulator|nr:response regulator transcription factor [Paludibacteraceae bacterium]
MANNRILVVDDEEDLCEILQFNLELEGYMVDVAHSAEEALHLRLSDYGLVLLDVMMGQISGFKMARMMRESEDTKHVPIIFITARDAENDLVTGFNLGADDYISKPFSIKEVILRVKAVMRRTAVVESPGNNVVLVGKINKSGANVISYEGIEVDLDSKSVMVDGCEVAFTKREFELLKLLIDNPNKVFSREEILKLVWHDDVCVLDRTVDVNITRVRKKIGRYGSNLVSRQGYGYSFKS